MKNSVMSVVAIIFSIVALSLSSMNLVSKDDAVAQALKQNPGLVVEALQKFEENSKQEQELAAKEIMASSIEEINNDAKSPFYGPVKADVTLAVFYDYSCGYCHRLYPILKSIIAKNPDVKIVFKPLDFLGPISSYSAKAVLAADNQGKFAELNDSLFGYDGQLTEDKINELAEKAGVEMEAMNVEMSNGSVETTLGNISTLARNIQIRGVPTMILNGAPLQTFDEAEIQAKINALKK